MTWVYNCYRPNSFFNSIFTWFDFLNEQMKLSLHKLSLQSCIRARLCVPQCAWPINTIMKNNPCSFSILCETNCFFFQVESVHQQGYQVAFLASKTNGDSEKEILSLHGGLTLNIQKQLEVNFKQLITGRFVGLLTNKALGMNLHWCKW